MSPQKQLEMKKAREARQRRETRRRSAQLTGGGLGLAAVAGAAWATSQMPQAADVMGIPSQAIAGGALMLMGVASSSANGDTLFSIGTALAAVGVHEMTKAKLAQP